MQALRLRMPNFRPVLIPAERTLVSVATYNERGNLVHLIEQIQQALPQADILIIDDNSPDGTGQLAEELKKTNDQLHVIHRSGKLGLGTAILTGMRFAMENNYDYMINMDADFSHPPECLPVLLAGMDQFDVMIGSRYIPGGGTKNWPISRWLMSRGVNYLVRLLLRLPAKDCSGGYRCYRVDLLRKAQLDRLNSVGYSFQQEVLHLCVRTHCKVGETPIIFENRKQGKSKVNFRETFRSLSTLFIMGIRSMVGLNK